jgi:hypothetical protein
MKQVQHALTFRAFPRGMASTRLFMASFGQIPENSISTLLRTSGPFIASRDAYQFQNSDPSWPLTDEDARVLRRHYEPVIDKVVLIGIEIVRSALTAVSVGPSISLPALVLDYVIGKITQPLRNKLLEAVVSSIPESYGRCGGMAFSGLDFFLAGWPVSSANVKPVSGALRQYIWTRLLDSLDKNAATFLEWIMVLKILPAISLTASAALGAAAGSVGGPVGAAIGSYLAGKNDVLGLGGPGALLQKTRDEWQRLRARLTHAAAWPVGFVYGDKLAPTDQHQVLAIGFTDDGHGGATVDVWDNNDGASCRKLLVDFRGHELKVASSNPNLNNIKGIICEAYEPKMPPQSLRQANTAQPVFWSPFACA